VRFVDHLLWYVCFLSLRRCFCLRVTAIASFHPIAFVGGQPRRVKNTIVLLIRFRNMLSLAALLRLGLKFARAAFGLRERPML
jgi:hypothetical protein